jgi:hypothetical protein
LLKLKKIAVSLARQIMLLSPFQRAHSTAVKIGAFAGSEIVIERLTHSSQTVLDFGRSTPSLIDAAIVPPVGDHLVA